MIDIIIDELTNCLQVRETGKVVSTYYKKRRKKFTDEEIRRMYVAGWNKNFNWKSVQEEGYEVYELRTEKDDEIQGYIALKHIKGDCYTFVPLVEASPWNIGSKGIYKGVGGHLFAIACKESWDKGNDGYVVFEAKSGLVAHYIETLGATIMYNRVPVKLLLDTKAAAKLIQRYFFAEEEKNENVN